MAVKKIRYYFDDGDYKDYPPHPTALEELERYKKEQYTLLQVKEELQRPLSKFDEALSLAFVYMTRELGLSDAKANELLSEWCEEWAVPNIGEE